MALFAIGDVHLSLGGDKAMDIFPGWKDYVQRLETNWRRVVAPEDTVVLVGDTSWGMALDECREDFAFLQALPGTKLLIKGNHDYWWNSRSKMEQYLAEQGFDSFRIIHNNSVLLDNCAVCGTRGWVLEEGAVHDEKILKREAGRLRASLEDAAKRGEGRKPIVFLHYPPLLATGAVSPDIIELMREHGVRRCYFGHLHGPAARWTLQGDVDGIWYKLISADSLEFCPYKVC